MKHPTASGFSLTANQIKLLALLSMTIDHMGLLLFPSWPIFRILGRLAFPLFAYMIAEGCRYTRHRARYVGLVLGVGVLCQVVYWFTSRSLYQCVMITFTLSILLNFCIDWAKARGGVRYLALGGAFAAVFFVCDVLPALFPTTDYAVDYGLIGVLLPVIIAQMKTRWGRLLAAGAGLILLSATIGGIQWYCLLALLPLSLYAGERGKLRLKYLFYIYYPLHLAVLWGIAAYLARG